MEVSKFRDVFLVFLVLHVLVKAQKCSPATDPCFSTMHEPFPQESTRHPSIIWDPLVHTQCDLYALSSDVWYKSDFNMTTTPPGIDKCGTKSPIWLNGTIPGISDWIVQRDACVNSFDSQCEKIYSVSIRNCHYFTVYCLDAIPSSCPQRYCFDIDLNRITTTTTTTTRSTTSPTTTGPTSSQQANSTGDWCSKEAVVALAVCLVVAVFGILALVAAIYLMKTKSPSLVLPTTPKRQKF